MWYIPRAARLVSVFLFATLAVASLTAQVAVDRPRIGVVPFSNGTGSPQNDVLATTTSDTIELTLRLVDQYTVVPLDTVTSDDLLASSPAALLQTAQGAAVDSLIYGTVTREANQFVFRLEVFDSAEGRVTVRAEQQTDSLFEVFDAADLLVADAVSGVSGVRIGFGTLQFTVTNQSTTEPVYDILIDGAPVGRNATTVERVLIGQRAVTVVLQRAGVASVLLEETVTLAENGRVALSVTVPPVTPEETARLGEFRALLDDAYRFAVAPRYPAEKLAAYAAFRAALVDALGDPADELAHLETRQRLLEELYGLISQDLAAEFLALRAGERFTRLSETITPWGDQHRASFLESSLDPEETRARNEQVRDDIERNATIAATAFELVSTSRAAAGDPEGAFAMNQLVRYIVQNVPMDYTRPTEYQQGIDTVNRYGRAVRRERPVWHWVAGIAGAAALGTAAYITIAAPDDAIAEDLTNRLIPQYEASVDFDEIVRLRSEIDDGVAQVGFLRTLETVGYISGGTLLSSAVVGRIVSRTRPTRIFRRYTRSDLNTRRLAAALDYRAWAESPTEPLVLVIGQDRDLEIELTAAAAGMESTGGSAAALDPLAPTDAFTPYSVGAPEGAGVTVRFDEALSGERSAYTAEVDRGINVIYLGAR